MSALNWTVCPRCKLAAIRDRKLALDAARALCGKTSAQQYEEAVREARKRSVTVGMTLREDYQLGVREDGSFHLTYHAECTRCDFMFEEHLKKNAVPEGESGK